VPPSHILFYFWGAFCCILSEIFVSSSMTDGLLWDDLSGSISQGNRENSQDPNGCSCF